VTAPGLFAGSSSSCMSEPFALRMPRAFFTDIRRHLILNIRCEVSKISRAGSSWYGKVPRPRVAGTRCLPAGTGAVSLCGVVIGGSEAVRKCIGVVESLECVLPQLLHAVEGVLRLVSS
jgi:hypothetical protein